MNIFLRIQALATILFCMLGINVRAAESTVILRGRVYVKDSTTRAADYVMVYAKEYGAGTTTDEQGVYTLSITNPKSSSISLEYSRMGFSAEYKTVALSAAELELEPVYLQPQPIMIMAAYVLPDNVSVSEYILGKVWKQSKINRTLFGDYDADVHYDIATHGVPMLSSIVSKFTLGIAKVAAGFYGYGPLVNYCLQNDDFAASVHLKRSVIKDEARDYEKTLLSSDKELPEKVKKNVTSVFEFIDLYDMIYGETTEWGHNFAKKHKFELVGTYEYGDLLVDILKYTDSKNKISATLHVVEDCWGILKVELGRDGEAVRCECRDIGNGVYMPVSFVIRPSLTMVKAQDIPKTIEQIQTIKGLDKGMVKRAVKLLEEHKERNEDFNPFISVRYNVRYTW